jgi:uncharacterized membrane protein YqhA
MTEPSHTPRSRAPLVQSSAELWLETILFTGRWLMAPVYLGLLVLLVH